MRAYLDSAKDLGDKEIVNRLGMDRTRLDRGVSSHHGPTPPYEALWIGEGGESSVLQEIAGIYARNGFTVKADLQERLDYIGVQLNYMECLVMSEISAREAEDEGLIQKALGQERNFLENHLAKWVPNFVSSALGHAQTDFYRGHLHSAQRFRPAGETHRLKHSSETHVNLSARTKVPVKPQRLIKSFCEFLARHSTLASPFSCRMGSGT